MPPIRRPDSSDSSSRKRRFSARLSWRSGSARREDPALIRFIIPRISSYASLKQQCKHATLLPLSPTQRVGWRGRSARRIRTPPGVPRLRFVLLSRRFQSSSMFQSVKITFDQRTHWDVTPGTTLASTQARAPKKAGPPHLPSREKHNALVGIRQVKWRSPFRRCEPISSGVKDDVEENC